MIPNKAKFAIAIKNILEYSKISNVEVFYNFNDKVILITKNKILIDNDPYMEARDKSKYQLIRSIPELYDILTKNDNRVPSFTIYIDAIKSTSVIKYFPTFNETTNIINKYLNQAYKYSLRLI